MSYGFEIVCASVFTVVCIISARIYSLLNQAYFYWDKKKVKGPLPRYVYGTWSGFAEKFVGADDYEKVVKYGKVCGTYDGLTPNLLVTDPELIQEILAPSSKFQDLRVVSETSVILKDSLLAISGGEKPEVRILTDSLLYPRKIEKLIPKLEWAADILIKNITETLGEEGLVNITSSVTKFVEEAIALAVFGIDLNSDIRLKEEFVKNTQQILKVKSPQSIWSLLPFLYENYFKESWILSEKVLQYFVELVISGMSDSSIETALAEGKTSSLIDVLVEAAEEEKKLVQEEKRLLTDNAIISKCIASVLSLANLTRTTSLFGIYALAVDEDVQDELYSEIEKNKSEITYDDIQNLSYLDKVVKEVLRLYPFEFRVEKVTTDQVKLGEIELEKQIRVSIPLYALHRLEDYYSEPDKFDPKRFSLIETEKRTPNTYLPFGQAGSNGSDISIELAVFAVKLIFFKLVKEFKFSVPQKLTLHKLFQKGFTRVPQPENINVFAEKRI